MIEKRFMLALKSFMYQYAERISMFGLKNQNIQSFSGVFWFNISGEITS